jgi:hypothetical protein
MDHQHKQLRRAAAQAFDESLNALEETFGADGDPRRAATDHAASRSEYRVASASEHRQHRTLEQAFQDAAADLEPFYPASPDA